MSHQVGRVRHTNQFDPLPGLRWKLNQLNTKSTPRVFIENLSHVSKKQKPTVLPEWLPASDLVLYLVFLSVVIAFVYVVIAYAHGIS